ncbi:tyrosine-type recombinase/integrase [Amycolatopsis minnesotensis]|uniref:Site-specific integrase n=1 Tax=Amycolatopsis minnesotensis TaxID=337894 RepID=A0ABP5EA93_9PSEU
MARGEWVDPERAKIELKKYATHWIVQRPRLSPATVALYQWLLRKHILPTLGGVTLGCLSAALIRKWRADLLAAGVSESVAAKCYRLLRAILNTAVHEDGLLTRNPCRVPGAGKERAQKRPVLTVAQVFAIADRMPPRFRVLVLLAAFCSLRWGEVSALRRCDLTDDASALTVTQTLVRVPGISGFVVGPPKSAAGMRTVPIPQAIRADILEHLALYADSDREAWLFTGERSGNPLAKSNFNQRTEWTKAMANLGLNGVHFHDLRHAGNTWASKTPGTSTKDLMARMGHDDLRAALIYQHDTSEVGERVAQQLSDLIHDHRASSSDVNDEDDDGPAGSLVPAT